jgi:hypothetical protein
MRILTHKGYASLSVDEIKQLVSGKFKISPCVECYGKGYVYSDENGEVFHTINESIHNIDDMEKSTCEDDPYGCGGLGFNIQLDELPS